MQRKLLVLSVIAVGVALGIGYAFAQRGPGREMGPGMHMGRGMMDLMSGCSIMGVSNEGQSSAFIDSRIAFIRAELGITEAQESAWDAYADAIKMNLQSMQDMRQTMQTVFEAKTPVERLDAHLAIMQSRTNALGEVKLPLVKLYDTLGVEQKKKADAILTGMGCMM